MRTGMLMVMMAGVALLCTSCGKKEGSETETTNAVGSNPLNAPTDYLGAMGKAKKSSEKTIDMISINQAISLFHASEGRFPRDLNELVTEQYMPKVPEPPYGMKIVYDATRGQVQIVPK